MDAEGPVLARAMVPADLQDRDTRTALDAAKSAWPSPHPAIVDGAFTPERWKRWCRLKPWCHLHGMRHHVVETPDQTAFVVPERRWVDEPSGGLLRDRAGRLDVAQGRLTCPACLIAACVLDNPDRE